MRAWPLLVWLLREAAEPLWNSVEVSNDPHQMLTQMSWPFRNGEFPPELGTIAMRSVAQGELPTLQVVHDPDGYWLVADGINDPSEPDACVVTHFSHVLASNSSVATLANMPPGTKADREEVGAEWILRPFSYEEQHDSPA